MPQEQVAHYKLRERLGAGAMGEVWLAEDTRLHRMVALKRLKPAAAGDSDAEARLLREARVASTLTHPNVAVVYDVSEGDGSAAYVAMEYVKGRTLAELLKDGRMDAAQVLKVAEQVAEALAEAHEHGIVHRDVKPGNVMLSERGLVKVLDFGLARYAPPVGEDSLTWSGRHGALEGMIVGTLAYMSPEQARGHAVDARSDVFSLGVVLYEMLTGRKPFEGRNVVELVEAIVSREPPPPSAQGGLAAGLSVLALRMLEKDRERRPADMREVRRELERVRRGEPATAQAGREHTVAVVGFANITGRPEDAWLATGLAESVSAGLAGVPGFVVVSRERILEVLRELGQSGERDDPAVAVRVGRELGVRGVVSGGYQSLGGRIRVTARLSETASGRVVLHPQVDGAREGIFELQDRLVAEIVEGLREKLPRGGARPEETQSLAAYEAFSKGLLNLQAESQEAIDRAIVFFERAIALDPDYARAHMMLGSTLDLKGDYLATPELSERALESLDRALALRPDSAEVWRYRGGVLITLGRDDEALAAYEMALSLNPTDASAHSGIGRLHFILRGDFEAAVASYERALSLNPRAGWAALQLAHCATFLRDFAKAEAAARRALELQQAFLSGRTGLVIVGAHMRLGHIAALSGRYQDALDEFQSELDFVGQVDHALRGRIFIELQQRIGEVRLRLGQDSLARAALDLALEAFDRRARTGAMDAMSPYYAACAYALRGEKDRALEWLDRASARRPRLTAARAALEPALESLRDEKQFQAVLQAGAAAGARGQDDPRAALSARGRELMAAGRYAEAVPVYRQLSAAAPESPGVLLNLGMALHLSGASREALAPLAEAARREPASYPAALMLGAARLRCGEPRAAVAPLKAAVRLRPDESEARSLLADALLAQGRHAEAGPQLEALARLSPEDASAWLRLGRSYEALATRAFETLLERGPESAYTLALVAEVRRDEGRADAALELYRKASERAPGMRGLHAAAAELEREAGRGDRAAAEEALERSLPKPDCARQTLECRFAAGRHREVVAAAATATTPATAYWLARSSNELAREAFARLEKLPPSAALHEWRAEQLRGEGRYADAAEEWRRAAAQKPRDLRLRQELAVTLRLNQDLAGAQAVLEQIVAEREDTAGARYLLGDVLVARQQPEAAIPHLERAVALDPSLAHAHAVLGRAYALVGRAPDAVPHLEKALAVDDDGSLHLQLARAYRAAGRDADAQRTLAEWERLRKSRAEAQAPGARPPLTPP